MLPAGAPTAETLQRLVPLLSHGDVVVDGANAMYKDSQRHAADLGAHGILFVDAGVSGGVWGLENGYGLMVGGDVAATSTAAGRSRRRGSSRARGRDSGGNREGSGFDAFTSRCRAARSVVQCALR